MAMLTSLEKNGVEYDLKIADEIPIFNLGDMYHDSGNVYMYAKASADLSPYAVLMTAAVTDVDLVLDATTNTTFKGKLYGWESIIKASAPSWTPGYFKGWYGFVDAGTGAGQVFEVEDNSKDLLYLKAPIATAVAITDSDIMLFSPFNVAETTASTSVPVVGVANRAIDASVAPYFWMQTEGVAAVLNGAANATAGVYLTTGDDTAGTCAIAATTTGLEDANIVGVVILAGATNDAPVWVKLNIH